MGTEASRKNRFFFKFFRKWPKLAKPDLAPKFKRRSTPALPRMLLKLAKNWPNSWRLALPKTLKLDQRTLFHATSKNKPRRKMLFTKLLKLLSQPKMCIVHD